MMQVRFSRGGGIGCLVLGILFFVALYYALKGLFALLWWAAPALLVLALIINWRAVADTGRDFLRLLERNPVLGLIVGAAAVVGFPILALYLFLRALGYSRTAQFEQTMRDRRQAPEEEFTPFEELDSRPQTPPPATGADIPETPLEPLERPKMSKNKAPKPENPYDQLFQ